MPLYKYLPTQETGEALLAGMGELHLEITVYRLEEEQGIKVNVSEPIVVYRESIESNNKGQAFEGKSPNRHNRFYIEAEPLPLEVIQALREGEFGDGTCKEQRRQSRLAINLQNMVWTKTR